MRIHIGPRCRLLALAVGLTANAALAAQPVPQARPGETVTVRVLVSSGADLGLNLRYRIRMAPGVFSLPHGDVEGTAGGHSRLEFPVRVLVPASQPPGLFRAAIVQRTWSDGGEDSLPIHVMVVARAAAAPPAAAANGAAGGRRAQDPPAPAAAAAEGQDGASVLFGGLGKEVEVELYGSSRTVHPGGLVVLRYSLNSYEDTDERLRLRVEAPEGWTKLDGEVEEREFLLEAWENVEGEVRLLVPRDVRVGTRHRVRVVAQVTGEPGGAAVFWPVQVERRGALRPGAVGLTGTASVAASNLQADGLEASRVGAVVALSGRLSQEATLSVHYRRGPRETLLTNFRIPQEETRWSGSLRGQHWNVELGNQIGSGGNAVVGPYVRGRGASFRRSDGLVVGDLTVAQPTSYVGDPGGLLVRGSLGLGGRWGRLLGTFSDFQRPVGGYSTLPRYPEDIDPDSLERLERERRALADASRNHVRGAGAVLELRPGAGHSFVVRGGMLRLWNAAGDTVQDPSAEAYYTFSHRLANVSAAWRTMPRSVQGVQLAGDQASLDVAVKAIGELRVTGRGYRSLMETVGDAFRSESEGASVGLRYYRQRWRVDLRANHREWSYGSTPTVARTASLSFGAPLGPLSLSGYLEQGVQVRDTSRGASATYRGELRWQARAGMGSVSTSYYETLTGPPRLRADALGSVKVGGWELAGGAWATRGWVVGGEPGFWTQLGIPATYDLLLSLGIEHAPTTWGAEPVWMGSIGIRKNVALPIPFLRDRSHPADPEVRP
jgi:hypothetical protein